MKRVLLIVLILLGVAAGGLGAYIVTFEPAQRPAAMETVELTPARIERGRYLVEGALDCFGCHTQRDWSRYGGPAQGPQGAGGVCLGEESGLPGTVCASNITPDVETGLGGWTNGEVLRAIREGVDKDGHALVPFMPYPSFRSLSDEDGQAIVAYLRTLPPVRNAVPEPEIKFPVNLLLKRMPQPLDGPVPAVDRSDSVRYGEYLAVTAGCRDCHTPMNDKHEPLPGMTFAGGQEMTGPWGVVRSANLTPHGTGLGPVTRRAFIARFKAFADEETAAVPVPEGANTVMPWLSFAQMTEADLGAIYDYLQTIAPIPNTVDRFPVLASHPQARQAGQPAG